MNDAMKALERQLELATARDGARETDLDPETARLRDAWTTFGRLLEAALPPIRILTCRGTYCRIRLISSATPASPAGYTRLSATARARPRMTADAISSAGKSAPRYVARHPQKTATTATISAPSSCACPDGVATTMCGAFEGIRAL